MLLDVAQRAIYDRLNQGPWSKTTYECGRRHTGAQSVPPSGLFVHPSEVDFEVSARCDLATDMTGLKFEAIVDFSCFVSPEGVQDAWRKQALRVEADGEHYLIHLRSVRIEEGPENGGATRFLLSFQSLKL